MAIQYLLTAMAATQTNLHLFMKITAMNIRSVLASIILSLTTVTGMGSKEHKNFYQGAFPTAIFTETYYTTHTSL